MPNLTFVMPHWLYWSGLVVFPLFAMYMVRRASAAPRGGGVSLSIAYMFLVTGGFVGIHRIYLRSWIGGLYAPLFIATLYANVHVRRALDAVSRVKHDLVGAEFMVERAEKALAQGADAAAAKLDAAKQALAAAQATMANSASALETWDSVAAGLVTVIAAFLLVDAFLLPRMTRSCAARESGAPAPEPPREYAAPAGTAEAPSVRVHSRFTDAIDAVSGWSGQFVCYWSLIAVFVYYYEVMARYVFNSPTNWAHESMFLMFGMQYLISGAFTYREDAHVRVDVIYLHFSRRGRVIADIVTSAFFFVFAGTLLWTGWTFAADSVNVWEVSFTEWAIQYWPVKMTIALGALLILAQGLSRLIKDILLLTGEAP